MPFSDRFHGNTLFLRMILSLNGLDSYQNQLGNLWNVYLDTNFVFLCYYFRNIWQFCNFLKFQNFTDTLPWQQPWRPHPPPAQWQTGRFWQLRVLLNIKTWFEIEAKGGGTFSVCGPWPTYIWMFFLQNCLFLFTAFLWQPPF